MLRNFLHGVKVKMISQIEESERRMADERSRDQRRSLRDGLLGDRRG
ncbi:MAG: hypothetical protein KGI04_03210 [Candidatus Micrarchaeota archaeon]|nr:hypothetical protein [Candidatus Micrarchaeota archaeon]